MVNHYDILGIKTSAGQTEIKTAFRRLAKMYHPDKNTEGKEHFEKILKAYETLSDPVLKLTYDYRLNYHLEEAQRPVIKQNPTTKTWSFEEKELKRRQYFNEHYKKNNKSTEQYNSEVEGKNQYNEYKYILFATPIAVALFLLIMKLAMPVQPTLKKNVPPITKKAEAENTQLKMGDMPYIDFFGKAVYEQKNDRQLTVSNETGNEVIVCLFTKTEFVRSFYISSNYAVQVTQLPPLPLYLRYESGTIFRHAEQLKEINVTGAFINNRQFFKRKDAIKQVNDTISLSREKEFTGIDATTFFKTTIHHDKKN